MFILKQFFFLFLEIELSLWSSRPFRERFFFCFLKGILVLKTQYDHNKKAPLKKKEIHLKRNKIKFDQKNVTRELTIWKWQKKNYSLLSLLRSLQLHRCVCLFAWCISAVKRRTTVLKYRTAESVERIYSFYFFLLNSNFT